MFVVEDYRTRIVMSASIRAAKRLPTASIQRRWHFESKNALVPSYLERRKESFREYMFNPETPGTMHEVLAKIDALT